MSEERERGGSVKNEEGDERATSTRKGGNDKDEEREIIK